jgi:hypothetical protein
MKCNRCGKDVDPVYPHTCTPLALKLADSLVLCWGDSRLDEAAAELRRLHAENEALMYIVHHYVFEDGDDTKVQAARAALARAGEVK